MLLQNKPQQISFLHDVGYVSLRVSSMEPNTSCQGNDCFNKEKSGDKGTIRWTLVVGDSIIRRVIGLSVTKSTIAEQYVVYQILRFDTL